MFGCGRMIGIEEACPPADTSSGRVPDGDKWSKTTKKTLGGSGVREANGVLLNSIILPSHSTNKERTEALFV